MNRNLPGGDRGPCPGAISLLREFVALSLVTALLTMAGCGGGSPDTSGRSAPARTIGGTIAGLDEGFVVISNGLDTKRIDANPDGLALDATFSLDTPLPAGAGYLVRIVNKPQEEFALQCDVINGTGVMPASNVDNVLVRCARVKSVRLLAGKIPSESDSRDGLATDARFLSPRGIAVDAGGNVYVADSRNGTIRRITPAGVVSTLAGSAGLAGFSDGIGPDARFDDPHGIAVDADGNVYVADTGNNAIRRITPAGVVSTLPVAVGTFNRPQGVAVDAGGNVYVSDTLNNIIRRITVEGTVSTLAPSTVFTRPQGVAVDSTGNVYVADTINNSIKRISFPEGSVTVIANTGFSLPCCIAVDSGGNVYVADTGSSTVRVISRVGDVRTLAGGTTRLGGSDDGVGPDARFNFPQGIAVDGAGNVYVADTGRNTVRRVMPAGVVSTLAGRATLAGFKDGIGSDSQFNNPMGVAVDSAGNVYVADRDNNTIRHITPTGVVKTFAGSATEPRGRGGNSLTSVRLSAPRGVAVYTDGSVYVADTGNNRILRVTQDGVLSILDGVGEPSMPFKQPGGLAVDAEGHLYVADTGNNVVHRITPSGVLEKTFMDVAFNGPQGIAVDPKGNVYVANTDSSTILLIASGEVKTIAGAPGFTDPCPGLTAPCPAEGIAGSAARFDTPQGVAIDAAGNVYVADSNQRTIRVLSSTGIDSYKVRTVVGNAHSTLTRIGSLPQPIGIPNGLALTPRRIYFTTGHAVLFIDR